MDFSKYGFKKFDGFRDFALWKSKVCDHLRLLGLAALIEGELANNRTKRQNLPTWQRMLRQMLSYENALFFTDVTRFLTVWLKVSKTVVGQTKGRLWAKVRSKMFHSTEKVHQLCVKERKETMMDFISRLKSLRSELEVAYHTVSDETMVLTPLLGYHNYFGHYVSSFTECLCYTHII